MNNKQMESAKKILRCPLILGLALLQAVLLGLAGITSFAAVVVPEFLAMEPWFALTVSMEKRSV